MTAREWTIEELDRVHPLPGDWEWMRDGARANEIPMWSAVIFNDHLRLAVSSIISVDQEGRLYFELGHDDTHTADVALAVVLASMGLDSREVIAAAIVRSGDIEERIGKAAGGTSIITGMARAAEAYRCAEMVRRGRVSP